MYLLWRLELSLTILTRFAIEPDSELEMFVDDGKFESGVHLTDTWFLHRFKFFTLYCVPSVRSQTKRGFRWCVFVDARLSSEKKKLLIESLQGIGELVEVVPGETFDNCVRRTLKDGKGSNNSVRLDSDDMISRDFVACLQRYLGTKDGVNFLHGVEYDVEHNTLKHRVISSNPFLFLSTKDDRHIFSYKSHVEIGRRVSLHNVATLRPMYCRVVHGRNTAVPRDGGLPVFFPGRCASHFGDTNIVFNVNFWSQVSALITRIGQIVFWLAPPLGRALNKAMPRL